MHPSLVKSQLSVQAKLPALLKIIIAPYKAMGGLDGCRHEGPGRVVFVRPVRG